MGRKCKICGYRFKSSDEAICPECFTAREDDISCERYSKNEHSHRSSYSSGLRDTGESFVQKELRLERNNQFAKENFGDRARAGLDLSASAPVYDRSRFERDDYNYDFSKEYRQIMSQSYPDRDTDKRVMQLYQQSQQPQPQQTAYQRFTAQQQRKANSGTTGFTPMGQTYAQRPVSPVQNSFNQRYNALRTTGQKKKNTAAGTVFLIFFIIMFVAAIIISRESERQERNKQTYRYTTTTRQTTAKTTAAPKSTTKKTTTAAKKDSNSTSGHYSAEVLKVTVENKKNSELSEDLLKYSTDFTHQQDPWREFTITVKVKPGQSFTDLQKEPTLAMATLQGVKNANAVTSLSYSTVHPKKKIEINNEGTEITLTMLAHKDAKLIYFTVFFQSVENAAKESVRFNITVNN